MEINQAHAGNQAYDENFYRAQKDGSFAAAVTILPFVNEFVHPRTVVDVGCGVGTWLAVWQKNFAAEIFGIDGDYVDRSQLLIDEKFFHPANLEERLNLNRRFDLAMSLEVAEHLTPARADSFVEDLTRLSDVVFFSAAIPVQSGGVNHVNEQWQSYWAEKFSQRGYVVVDCIRPKVWLNDGVPHICYRQNVFIYAKSTELYRYPELQDYYLRHRDATILNLVHPRYYIGNILQFKKFYQQVQEYLEK